MSSTISSRLKSIFNRSDTMQPVSSGNDMIFEITEHARRRNGESGDDDTMGQRTKNISKLITSRTTYLEGYLNFHYYLGVAPFQLLKNGKRQSSRGLKITKYLILFLALLDIFVKLNLNKATITANKHVSNNIEVYVEWLQLVAHAISIIVFMRTMLSNDCGFSKLLSTLQKIEIAELTHNKYIWATMSILCASSFLGSLLIPIIGLDVVPFAIVRQDGWSLLDVFLQREYNTVKAFTKLRVWNENATNHVLNTGITNSSDWTPLTIILGGIGTLSSSCAMLVGNAVVDLVLSSTVMLFVITRGMKLDEGDQLAGDMNMTETHTLFKDITKRFTILSEISDSMNAVVAKLIPSRVLVNGLAIVDMINLMLGGNWSGVTVLLFAMFKDAITVYLATSITTEVEKYEDWLVKPGTQEILRLEPNQLQTMLHGICRNKIGIGKGVYHINEGLIANFLGLTSTYFFIVAEAQGEELKN